MYYFVCNGFVHSSHNRITYSVTVGSTGRTVDKSQSDQFQKRILEDGLYASAKQQDGNCMFHAIASQLCAQDCTVTAGQVRHDVVEFIRLLSSKPDGVCF